VTGCGRARSTGCWPTMEAPCSRRLLRRLLHRFKEGSSHHPGPSDGNGHGPPGLRGALGPRGLRPTRGGPALAGRLWGGHGSRSLPSDRPGRSAQPAAGLVSSPTTVRGHQGGGKRDRGHEEPGPGARLDPHLRCGGHRGHRHPAPASIRKVLSALDQVGSPLATRVRAVLVRDDDYATSGKPPCDWDDRSAREALVDTLVRDALAALEALDGQEIPAARPRPSNCWPCGRPGHRTRRRRIFRIVRKVAKDG